MRHHPSPGHAEAQVECLALASIRRTDEGDLDAGIALLDAALLDAALAWRAIGKIPARRSGRSFPDGTVSYSLDHVRD